MLNYFKNDYLEEKKVDIGGIPSIVFRPKEVKGKIGTIILYHGWSSKKERQRITGYILASLGYQVVLPDSINHGERGALEDYGPENSIKYFWPTVFQGLNESSDFLDEIIKSQDADPEKIGLIGHSMGAIGGLGVFAHEPRIKTIVAINGSGAWENFNSILREAFLKDEEMEDFSEMEERIRELDPINNLDLISSRPILLLHGLEDNVVDIRSQEYFYQRAKEFYEDKRKLSFIKYKNTKHIISRDMLEDAIKWFRKHIKTP